MTTAEHRFSLEELNELADSLSTHIATLIKLNPVRYRTTECDDRINRFMALRSKVMTLIHGELNADPDKKA